MYTVGSKEIYICVSVYVFVLTLTCANESAYFSACEYMESIYLDYREDI